MKLENLKLEELSNDQLKETNGGGIGWLIAGIALGIIAWLANNDPA